jgi:hypothetical protein
LFTQLKQIRRERRRGRRKGEEKKKKRRKRRKRKRSDYREERRGGECHRSIDVQKIKHYVHRLTLHLILNVSSYHDQKKSHDDTIELFRRVEENEKEVTRKGPGLCTPFEIDAIKHSRCEE